MHLSSNTQILNCWLKFLSGRCIFWITNTGFFEQNIKNQHGEKYSNIECRWYTPYSGTNLRTDLYMRSFTVIQLFWRQLSSRLFTFHCLSPKGFWGIVSASAFPQIRLGKWDFSGPDIFLSMPNYTSTRLLAVQLTYSWVRGKWWIHAFPKIISSPCEHILIQNLNSAPPSLFPTMTTITAHVPYNSQ